MHQKKKNLELSCINLLYLSILFGTKYIEMQTHNYVLWSIKLRIEPKERSYIQIIHNIILHVFYQNAYKLIQFLMWKTLLMSKYHLPSCFCYKLFIKCHLYDKLKHARCHGLVLLGLNCTMFACSLGQQANLTFKHLVTVSKNLGHYRF